MVPTNIKTRSAGEAPSPAIPSNFEALGLRVQPRPFVAAIQRFFDLALGAVLLIALLPLFVLIALVIKSDSAGPILFQQRRVGKDGREFWFYKFRSMRPDAEDLRAELMDVNERDGPMFKISDDPRVTRVGRLLRKYSVDELPQLLNVLLGDMSLVGPRPALPLEVAQYSPYHRQRLIVTPGLTGLWQVSGRANLSFDHSVDLDLYYIEHQSLWLNLWIMLRTVPAVLSARGAY